MEKNGFETYLYDDKLPDDFVKGNNNKVFADLDIVNTLFTTKIKIIL